MKFLLIFSFLFAYGCADKSEVTPTFEAIPLRVSHGDGKYAIFTVKLPLSDNSIETYESPIDPTTGVARIPLLGDVLRFVTQATFNLGAGIGLGKSTFTIKQPIPNLDTPYINSVSIKRVFFHIDRKDLQSERRQSPGEWLRSLIRGSTKLNFDFIRQMKINMRMSSEGEPVDYIPEIIEDTAMSPITRDSQGIIQFLNYHRKSRSQSQSIQNAVTDRVIAIYTPQPAKLRAFLRSNPNLMSSIKEMNIINKSVFIELVEDSTVKLLPISQALLSIGEPFAPIELARELIHEENLHKPVKYEKPFTIKNPHFTNTTDNQVELDESDKIVIKKPLIHKKPLHYHESLPSTDLEHNHLSEIELNSIKNHSLSYTEQFILKLQSELEFEPSLEISKIISCSSKTCMDLDVNKQNLLPLLLQGDRLNIETFIDASKVPPRSFQLKGFIEFEVKLDLPL